MTTPWHESTFWVESRAVMFPESRWTAAHSEVDAILTLCGPADGARVLDLPCGPGRHALELGRRGYDVVGVDRTTEYLQEARTRANAQGVPVHFLAGDMRTFFDPEGFDLALNLFTSFGYFEDPEDDVATLRAFRKNLRPGGKLVLDLMGKEVLARTYTERRWYAFGNGKMLEHTEILDDWSRVRTTWTLLEDGRERSQTFTLRLYCANVLKGMLARCGFSRVRAYGGLDGSPYGPSAQRLVVVAEAHQA